MRKLFRKTIDIFFSLLCLWFIIFTFKKYFILHGISLKYLILIELFLCMSLIVSIFIVFDKMSSLNDILNQKKIKLGDFVLSVWGLIFGFIILYMTLFTNLDKIMRNVLIFASMFFILGGVFLFITVIMERKK
ncbi:MAG: hypothetical protein ABIH18_04880 [Candidatus Omnitrophota bacterium]